MRAQDWLEYSEARERLIQLQSGYEFGHDWLAFVVEMWSVGSRFKGRFGGHQIIQLIYGPNDGKKRRWKGHSAVPSLAQRRVDASAGHLWASVATSTVVLNRSWSSIVNTALLRDLLGFC